jgi:hypothetical protein
MAACYARGQAMKRQDDDLIVIESADAAAAFKHNFDARFASGQAYSFARQN